MHPLYKEIRLMQKYRFKIIGLIVLIFVFSVLYSLLDSSHFQGLNPLQDQIKEDIVKKEIETFQTYEKETVKRNVEQVVKEEEQKIENPQWTQIFFDRFYFSTITACLLGYGDIYPATNTLKALVSVQSFCTVCLILY